MNFLKCFVLFATLFFISAQAASTRQNELKSDVLINMIEKMIINITEFLSHTCEKGEKIIDYLSKDGLDHIQAKTMLYAEEMLEYAEKIIQSRVDNMNGDMDKEGLKLYGCVKDNIKTINPAILSYWDNSTKCVNTDVRRVATMLKPILQVLEKVDKKIAEDAKGLEKCGTGDAGCLLGVALEILNELSTIPVELASDFWALFKEIASLLPTIRECSRAAATEWGQELFEQMGVIAKCVGK